MYEKKYVDYLGHKGTILPRYNGDWVYYDGPDVPSNYPPIRFIASVDTKADPETEKAREEFFKRAALRNILNTVYGLPSASSDKSKSNNDISKPKMTHGCPGIKKVIFNDPATIVLWDDGTKTVVKCSLGDTYSEWSGLAFCICKKLMGDEFHKVFTHWCDRDDIRKPIYDVRHTDPGCHSESVSHYGKDEITNMLESFAKAADIINQLSDKL